MPKRASLCIFVIGCLVGIDLDLEFTKKSKVLEKSFLSLHFSKPLLLFMTRKRINKRRVKVK
jgi:hypothetical protein